MVVPGVGVSSKVLFSYGLATTSSIKPGKCGYFLGFAAVEDGGPEIGLAEREVVGGVFVVEGAKVTARERGCEAEDAGLEVDG